LFCHGASLLSAVPFQSALQVAIHAPDSREKCDFADREAMNLYFVILRLTPNEARRWCDITGRNISADRRWEVVDEIVDR
jgi:hypothetical protein